VDFFDDTTRSYLDSRKHNLVIRQQFVELRLSFDENGVENVASEQNDRDARGERNEKIERSAGKYTFYFDDKGNVIQESVAYDEDREHVIPLHVDEYRVEDEPVRHNQERLDDADWKLADNLFEPHSLGEYTSDAGMWHHAFESESEGERVERIIRQSESAKRTASSLTRKPEPEPVLETPELPVAGAFGNRNDNRANWWKAALSVTGAVLTGVALGLFVLGMLQQGEPNAVISGDEPTLTVTAAVNGDSGNSAGQGEGTQAAGNKAIAASDTARTIGPVGARTYSFLQHGVFATAAASQSAISALKQQGLASAVENGERTIVYAGFTLSKEDAQRLAKLLQAKKIDIYVKPITLPAINGIKWSGAKPESVGAFLSGADRLIRMMGGATVTHLDEEKPTPFDQATVKAILDAYQLWAKGAADLQDGGEQARMQVQAMTQAMEKAVASLQAYAQKPSAALLWEAQSSLMQAVIAEKQLQALIAV